MVPRKHHLMAQWVEVRTRRQRNRPDAAAYYVDDTLVRTLPAGRGPTRRPCPGNCWGTLLWSGETSLTVAAK